LPPLHHRFIQPTPGSLRGAAPLVLTLRRRRGRAPGDGDTRRGGGAAGQDAAGDGRPPHRRRLAAGGPATRERKLHRVGPNCEAWPKTLTENLYQRLNVGPQFGPTPCSFRSGAPDYNLPPEPCHIDIVEQPQYPVFRTTMYIKQGLYRYCCPYLESPVNPVFDMQSCML
jgi:hypothetical protein